jgi:hypothetical protein
MGNLGTSLHDSRGNTNTPLLCFASARKADGSVIPMPSLQLLRFFGGHPCFFDNKVLNAKPYQ